MFTKAGQHAWISGMPGLKGDISLQVQNLFPPKPDARSLTVNLVASSDLVSALQSLSKDRTKISALRLVVRTDAAKGLDNQYQMTGALIDSVLPVKDLAGVQAVTILYSNISIRMGVSLNPGPPDQCPPIDSTGMNTGWIFARACAGEKAGTPFQVIDFTPPYYNRRLTVALGKPSSEIQALIQNSTPPRELILVLPDRISGRYIEFKLWDPKIIIQADDRHVAFESDVIECLTGEDA